MLRLCWWDAWATETVNKQPTGRNSSGGIIIILFAQ